MQQIADWLGKVGLSEYAQRFAENDIDFTILGGVTDQDLEKIGIASLGHRRKLLRRSMQPESIAPWRCVLAKTCVWQCCRFGHGPCGSLATLMPRSSTPTKLSAMRAKSITPPR
jgi:hypothetical protein